MTGEDIGKGDSTGQRNVCRDVGRDLEERTILTPGVDMLDKRQRPHMVLCQEHSPVVRNTCVALVAGVDGITARTLRRRERQAQRSTGHETASGSGFIACSHTYVPGHNKHRQSSKCGHGDFAVWKLPWQRSTARMDLTFVTDRDVFIPCSSHET